MRKTLDAPINVSAQPSFSPENPCAENPDYLTRQLITYLGNKRALLGFIGKAIDRVTARMGKARLRVFDAFSGSGVVSRFLKAHASLLVSNDLEDYAAVTGRCYLANRSAVDLSALAEIVADMNARVAAEQFPDGFIEEMYSPSDEKRITKSDRVFYTKANARRLDAYRQLIDSYPAKFRDLLLGPLLSEASIHANTAGVFKGFYKNRRTQVGQFGGSGADALVRILGEIRMEAPILSRFECDCEVWQEDANVAARRLEAFDLAYIDPPYNQHPYGSNYFMLNLLARYQRPTDVSRVSGIPTDWRRSGYNVRSRSLDLMRDLLESLDAAFLLVSFNNEGFISPAQMRSLLEAVGTVETLETRYNAFRGSRNFSNRSIHVTEHLFLVERS
ncbi:MAG: DNA modification methylase [Planctomycetes bacterium]|nr:DNA modification methylase [Planctomycetota bacterium]